jgi:hypothetical protein
MKKRNAFIPLFLLCLVFVAFLVRRWNEPKTKEAFDRHPPALVYSKHALCRMACRRISKEEIAEIMEKGVINFNRSDRHDRPCPTFALQGRTSDGDNIRVIFAQCPSETKVVTCYNLEKDFLCHCPGDENKKMP